MLDLFGGSGSTPIACEKTGQQARLAELDPKYVPDVDQTDKARAQLTQMAINGELDELAQQASLIKAEAQGEGWFKRSWRPIVMLVFIGLIVLSMDGMGFAGLDRSIGVKTSWYRATGDWRVYSQ